MIGGFRSFGNVKTHCHAMLWTNHVLKISRCISCSSSTNFVCLTCKKSACNKSKDCFVPADEETPGCGKSRCFCGLLFILFQEQNREGQETQEKPLKEDKKQNQLTTRKCLSLFQKVEVIHASKDQAQSVRQLAKRF